MYKYMLMIGIYASTLLGAGELIWSDSLEVRVDSLKGYAVQRDQGGNLVIAGISKDDAIVVKINASTHRVIWKRIIGGNGEEAANDLIIDNTGDIVVAGYTSSVGNGGKDVMLIKLNPTNGDIIWLKTYGGANDDKANSIAMDLEGNYIVAGYTRSFGSNADEYLLKVNEDGDTLWTAHYDCSNVDNWAMGVAVDSAGNYIIAGQVKQTWDDGSVRKVDTSGNVLWLQVFGNSDGQFFYDVAVDNAGNYVAVGKNYVSHDRMWVIKLAEDGTKLWEHSFIPEGTEENARAYTIMINHDNYYIIGGVNQYDAELIVVDEIGNMLSSHQYATTGDERICGIVQDTDGGYVLAGYTDSYNSVYNILVIKTDTAFASVWSEHYLKFNDKVYGMFVREDRSIITVGSSEGDAFLVRYSPTGYLYGENVYKGDSSNMFYEDDGFYDVVWDNDLGVYVAVGYTSSFGNGRQLWIVKIDPNFYEIIAYKVYGGASDEAGKGIAIDNDGNYVVVGYTYSYGNGQADYWILKIDRNSLDTIWTRTFGGTESDMASGIAVDRDGNYVILGSSWSFSNGYDDFYVLKLTPGGDTIWSHHYGTPEGETAYKIIVDHEGYYVAAGKIYSDGYDYPWLVKIDPNDGSAIWTYKVPRETGWSHSRAYTIAEDSLNRAYIIGGYASNGGNVQGMITIISAYNPRVLAREDFGGENEERFWGVEEDSENNIIAAGYTNSTTEEDYDVYVVKISIGDIAPPVIDSMTVLENDTLYPFGPYYIYAKVSDNNAIDSSSVKLYYKIGNDTFMSTSMELIASNWWSGVIPSIEYDQFGDTLFVQYYITAKDTGGLQSWSDTLIFGLYLPDTVGPAIDSLTVIENDTSAPYGPYPIRVKALPTGDPIDSVVLYWKRAGMPSFISSIMNFQSNDWYMDTIPEQSTPEDSFQILYYIIAFDEAGNISTSDTVNFWVINPLAGVKENGKPILKIKIPTLMRRKLNMEITVSQSLSYTLKIYTPLGNIIKEMQSKLNRGRNIVNIDLPKNGVYFIEFQTKHKTFRKKIILLK